MSSTKAAPAPQSSRSADTSPSRAGATGADGNAQDNESDIREAQELTWTMNEFRPANTVMVIKAEPVDEDAPMASGSAAVRRKSMRSLRRFTVDGEDVPSGDGLSGMGGIRLEESVNFANGAGEDENNLSINSTADALASEMSVRQRAESFRPFNIWKDDRSALFSEEYVDKEEPIDLLPEDQRMELQNKRFFQVENNASTKHYDVRGFNVSQKHKKSSNHVHIAHVEDDAIAYCSGQHLTTVGLIDCGARKMLPRHEACVEIGVFCVSSNGKYAAIAERRVDGQWVSVTRIDSGTKVALLNIQLVATTEVVSLALASNNKFAVTVTAPPDHKLVMWQLDDVRILATVDLSKKRIDVAKVSFCPWESTRLATHGAKQFSVWEYRESALNATDVLLGDAASKQALQSSKIADHCWYDEDCLCAITEDGVMIGAEQKKVVYCSATLLPPINHAPPERRERSNSMAALTPKGLSPKMSMLLSSSKTHNSSSVLTRNMTMASGQPQQKRNPNQHLFRHVVWASRGIIAVTASGTFALLDRTYDSKVFQQICVFHLTQESVDVLSVSMSPAEENLVVALNNNSMEIIQLAAIDTAISSFTDVDGMNGTLPISRESQQLINAATGAILRTTMAADDAWGYVLQQSLFTELQHVTFHDDTITAISVAIQAPVLLTSSDDGTIRVYDFITHDLIAFRRFQDAVLSASIHPDGLHCVVTSEFSTSVFGIVGGSLHQMVELDVRNAQEVRYSRLGGRIAFCVGNRILIHDGHSYEYLGQLLGHTVMIKSLSWACNDQRVVTTDVAGTVCGWDATTFRRDGLDASQKNLVMQCAMFHSSSGLVAAVGSNKHAQRKVFEGEFTIVCSHPNNQAAVVYVRPGMLLPKSVSSRKLHTNLLALAELSQTLFVGTPTGRILLYSWPLIQTSKPYDHIDSHTSEVIHIALSSDERFLFSISADNILYIHKVDQQKEGRFVNVVIFNYDLFRALRYSLRSDKDAFDRDLAALKQLVEERRRANELAYKQDTAANAKANVDFANAQKRKLERLKYDLETSKLTRMTVEKKTIQQGITVESSYSQAAESLEVQYNRLQEESHMRYLQLEKDKNDITVKYEALISQRIMAGDIEMKRLEAANLARDHHLCNEILAVDSVSKDKMRRGDATLAQNVIDYETQLKDMSHLHEKNIKKNENSLLKAAAVASIGDREVERLGKECNAAKQLLNVKKQTMKDIQHQLERRARESQELKLQMVAKQEAINVAEKKLQQLKQQLVVLENIRFVLLHQLEAEEAESAPKDERIEELSAEIVDIEKELNVQEDLRMAAVLGSQKLEERITHAMKDLTHMRFKKALAARRLNTLLATVTSVSEQFKDPLQFSVLLKRTVAKLGVEQQPTPQSAPSPALEEEFATIRTTLQRQKAAVSTIPMQRQALLEEVNGADMIENRNLVREMESLRADKLAIQTQVGIYETQLREVRNALTRLVTTSRQLTIKESESSVRHQRPPLMQIADRPPSRQEPSVLLPSATPSPLLVDASPIGTSGPPTVARRTLLSPVIVHSTKPMPSVTPVPTPALADLDVTWGSVKKTKKLVELPPRPKGVKRGPAAASSGPSNLLNRRSEFQAVISQLEDNTARMKEQQLTVATLRDCVRRLLAVEEQRLLAQWNAAQHPEAASPAPAPSSAVGGVDATAPLSMDMESPDWVAQQAESGRPMTPVKKMS